MGLGRTILLAVVGPFLVYYAFLGHVAYRTLVETPDPIEVQVCKMSQNVLATVLIHLEAKCIFYWKNNHSHIARLILTNKRWPGNLHDV